MSKETENPIEGSLARVLELAQKPRSEDPADLIHRVIDQCLLNMVFQPIVDLKTGTIFAYEALCRSRVPQFENPPAMIEAAAAAGRIGELGRLQRSLASKNCPDWPIFVNISPNEFDEGYLVRPDDAIFRHRKPVYIEITESVPLVFFEQCHSVLAELRQKGARLAIDDLGAGYSNLKYIADLAPDIVKLDRELVAGCTMDGTHYELLCSIAKLCREVNAQVVAEGVETAEELEAVSSAGIEYCQGFFLGRPKVSPSELTWPASELVTSDSFKVLRATRAVERNESSPEDDERRLDELEAARAMMEKSVRRARGEVVRLRKALSKAESQNERSQTRLADIEDSLSESETNRRRLARLFEEAALRNERQAEVEAQAVPASPKLKKVAAHALIWAAGLLAGLALYVFDPRVQEPRPRSAVEATATLDAAPLPAPAAPMAAASDLPAEAAGAESVDSAVAEPVPQPVELSATAVEPPTDPAEKAAAEPPPDRVPNEVRSAVLAWSQAWSEQDVNGYLSQYSSGFVSEDGLSDEGWAAQRRSRLAAPTFLEIRLEGLEIEEDGQGSATARFHQLYASDTYSDQVRKELRLAREDGAWRIVSETVLE